MITFLCDEPELTFDPNLVTFFQKKNHSVKKSWKVISEPTFIHIFYVH